MRYVGNTALSPQIQERIQNTFQQTLGLAEEGNRQEALLGCDFILRLDPLFEPARRLQERLSEGEGPVSIDNLEGEAEPEAADAPAPEAVVPAPEPVQAAPEIAAEEQPAAASPEMTVPDGDIPGASVDIGELIADASDEDPLVGDTPVEVTPPALEFPEPEPPALESPDLEMPLEDTPTEVLPLGDESIDLLEPLPEESADDEAPVEAGLPTRMAMLLEQRNFQEVMSLAMQNQERVKDDKDLQQMVGLANERLEAEPYVRNFLESAQIAKDKEDLENALSHLEKARELDASHPDIPRLEADIEAASRAAEPPAAFEPPSIQEVPQEDAPPLVEEEAEANDLAEADDLAEVDEFFASVESAAGDVAPVEETASEPDLAPVAEPEPELQPEAEAAIAEPKAVPSLDAEPAARLDSESEQRIDDLLGEGQTSFESGQYQTAIDAWSRIFLIDIDHAEASRRIELARKLKAEVERQTEEAFHEGITHLESGSEEKAKEAFNRVLEMQPNHMGARDYLDKIESGDLTATGTHDLPELDPAVEPAAEPAAVEKESAAAPEPTPIPDIGPSMLDETDDEDAVAPAAPAPTPSRRSFTLIGTAVLVLVLAVGWFVWSNWDRFFPASAPEDPQTTAQPRADPIERARELHEAGNTAMAINVLRRLPPGSDQYAEAQALIANWEAGDPAQDLSSDLPSEELLAQRLELLTQADQAVARGENLLAMDLLAQASEIQELTDEELPVRQRAVVALELLKEERDLFDQGDWEYALPNLWRMHDADPNNPDVLRLMVDSYYNLGLRDLQRGDAKSALEKFEEAQELLGEADAELERLARFSSAYSERSADTLYRIFVKYQRFR